MSSRRHRLRSLIQRATGLHVARSRSYHLVRRSYQDPIPEPQEDAFWDRERPLPALDLDTEVMIELAERELAEGIREFSPPQGFDFANAYYASVDAEVAHALLRARRPRTVIELGSGYSTLVIAAACRANARDGAPVEYSVLDPHPRPGDPGLDGLEGVSELRRVRTQDVDPRTVDSLDRGDVLFVDTTHTVKVGSDVNTIVLELLPRLRPGVLVHFHDVFLPSEYPRPLVEQLGLYWAEQYLLEAFLSFNDAFRVVFAAHAVSRRHQDRLRALVPSYDGSNMPSSFWIERRPG
jgi:predicted O-methyltransferase YrrM